MRRARFAVAILLLLGAAALAQRAGARIDEASPQVAPHIALNVERWSGRDVALSDRQLDLLETRDVLYREYECDGVRVLACIAAAGAERKAAHPPEICYRGQGWSIVEQTRGELALAGRVRPFQRLVIEKSGERQLVLSWFAAGGELTASWWREQWLAVLSRLAGRDEPVALLRFSTRIDPHDDGAERAVAAIERFLQRFLPAADAALAGPAAPGESRAPR